MIIIGATGIVCGGQLVVNSATKIATSLGMSEKQIFWKIIVPTAAPGITSGTILTFARALGEYGATSMLAGNIQGKTGTIDKVDHESEIPL